MAGYGEEKFLDLIYSRFGSGAADSINTALRHHKGYKFVNTVLNQMDEERCWQMYLAQVSNALVDFDKLGSFEEYKQRVKRNAEKQRAQSGEQAVGVGEKRLKLLTNQANNTLKNFTPPPKR